MTARICGMARYGRLAAFLLAVAAAAISATLAHAQTAAQEAAAELFGEGFTLYQSGDFDSAQEFFENGLQLDPQNVAALYFLGRVLEQRGDYNNAIIRYSAATKHGPQTKNGILAQLRLGTIEKKISILFEKFAGPWCRSELLDFDHTMGQHTKVREFRVKFSNKNNKLAKITFGKIIHKFYCNKTLDPDCDPNRCNLWDDKRNCRSSHPKYYEQAIDYACSVDVRPSVRKIAASGLYGGKEIDQVQVDVDGEECELDEPLNVRFWGGSVIIWPIPTLATPPSIGDMPIEENVFFKCDLDSGIVIDD